MKMNLLKFWKSGARPPVNWVIVGLGNPGEKYAKSRHNLGFMCVNQIARAYGITFDQKRRQARSGTGRIEGIPVVLSKPQTYMNLSGGAIAGLLDYYKVSPENLIVIHDDLDLPTGKLRIRQGGGSGGHRGIGSTGNRLGSFDFTRIRVGIDRPRDDFGNPVNEEHSVAGYVLRAFPAAEKPPVEAAVARVCEAVVCILTEGVTEAMNRFN
jgi:peptidyl-tRNA hydrolase, PTH1 family